MEKAIITSCSNKFFPSVVNLIGSMKVNYPSHPKIYVYDLGLLPFMRKYLSKIENVEVIKMPQFISFWRSCYTWKTYILSHPLARLNFYIDAGNQVLKSLDEVFDQIEKNDYFIVEQGDTAPLELITPKEYKSLFPVKEEFYKKSFFTAGIVGFKENSKITKTLEELHQSSLAGLCLGFSETDKRRNKGVNKTIFVRDCKLFRHDTTIFSLLIRKNFSYPFTNLLDESGMGILSKIDGNRLLWNFRLNFIDLEYYSNLNRKNLFIVIYIKAFLSIKKWNLFIKRILRHKGIYIPTK